MTMQSLINIDGNGLKDVLIDLNDKLATAVGWIANKETPEKIAINTYIKEIQEKNYDSDSAWSIPDPVTYCLLCVGLAGDKDTSAEGEKISDGTCDLRSFLGNSVRAAFAFANADQKRQ